MLNNLPFSMWSLLSAPGSGISPVGVYLLRHATSEFTLPVRSDSNWLLFPNKRIDWLPVKQRHQFKICLNVHKIVHSNQPNYISYFLLTLFPSNKYTYLRGTLTYACTSHQVSSRPSGLRRSRWQLWSSRTHCPVFVRFVMSFRNRLKASSVSVWLPSVSWLLVLWLSGSREFAFYKF